MGWNPLDESLLSSSLLSEGPDVVATWALLIASANRQGESHLTVPFIASVLRISEERVEAAFVVLTSPDRRSRNKEHAGRRIVPAPDGWLLVSHAKYREKASRMAAADRQARYLARMKERQAAPEKAREPGEDE
jgi:hypothetical protein